MSKSVLAALVFGGVVAASQTAALDAETWSCGAFRALVADAGAGSQETLALQAAAYENALLDAFTWYHGRDSVEREWRRVIERCSTTLPDTAEKLSEDVFDEFESEIRMQIEYESE